MSTARRALSLVTTCATTGIGSLPHSQSELALQVALQQDVPYLPQLPHENPGELMIPAALDGLPGLHFDAEGTCTIELDEWRSKRDRTTFAIEQALKGEGLSAFEPTVQSCRAWAPFTFEVKARHVPFAKVQLAGPATVRWVAKTSSGAPTSDLPELDQQLFRFLLAKGLALVHGVRKAGATPVVFLDEPGLFALDPRNVQHTLVLKELQMMVVALQQAGALVGLHCCSNTHWGEVLNLGLDILSIDARLSLDAVLEEKEAWVSFIASGATLSLGIVPTDLASSYQLGELCDSVEASLRATMPRGSPFEAVLSRMLLSPACGLGMRSVLDADRIVTEVREAQRRFRALVAG